VWPEVLQSIVRSRSIHLGIRQILLIVSCLGIGQTRGMFLLMLRTNFAIFRHM
jgi:hypothetical protein